MADDRFHSLQHAGEAIALVAGILGQLTQVVEPLTVDQQDARSRGREAVQPL
jgi:hypothetical protein